VAVKVSIRQDRLSMSASPGEPSAVNAPSRGATAAIGLTAIAIAVVMAILVRGSEHVEDREFAPVFAPLVALSFIGTGLYAWRRRQESRYGLLMVAIGFAWFLPALTAAESPPIFTIGMLLGSAWAAVLIHLLLSSFPSGRLTTPWARRLAVTAYVVFLPAVMLVLLFGDADVVASCKGPCPENAFQLVDDNDIAEALLAIDSALAALLCASVLVVLVRRWRAAGPALRRALGPIYAAGVVLLAAAVAMMATGAAVLEWVTLAAFAALPFAFLAGLLRVRLARAAVGDLFVALRANPEPAALRDALAGALGDSSLRLAYWLPELGAYADLDGMKVDVEETPGRAVTRVDHDGRPVAVMLHDAALLDAPELLDAVSAAADIALENARLHVELHAQLDELKGSRARLLEATQDERRRLERNLHDGAQQRLVAMSLELTLMERRLREDPALAGQVERLRGELAAALDELRDLARGLHPAAVTTHGLGAALDTLAARSPVRVRLQPGELPRLPEPIEVAIYFFVAECLTNVAKYAHAREARVTIRVGPDEVIAEVADDGVGGANPRAGTGLLGLADRVETLGGHLEVDSPAGGGTRVSARVPCVGAALS
jgi:signal transduction histidine kinase